VSRWSSPYDLTLPGTTAESVRRAVADHRTPLLRPGLKVWLGPSLRFGSQAMKATLVSGLPGPTSPVLSAALLPDSTGVRLSGRLSWTSMLLTTWGALAFTVFAGSLAIAALAAGDIPAAISFAIGSLVSDAFSRHFLKNQAAYREMNDARLTAALVKALGEYDG